MNTALKQHHEELTALETERAELIAKMTKAGDVEQQAGQVEATAAAIESKRRGTLGRWFLGEQVDIAAVDAELAAAKKQAEAIAPTAEGAAAAREYLQGQLAALNAKAAQIRHQIEVERWKAVYSAAGDKAKAYIKLCDDVVAAYADLMGTAMLADSMRPTDASPRCYSAVAPAAFTFPAQMMVPEFAGFRMTRDIYSHRTRAETEAAALARFRDAGILEGAA